MRRPNIAKVVGSAFWLATIVTDRSTAFAAPATIASRPAHQAD